MQTQHNNDFIQECNFVIVKELSKKTVDENGQAQNMFAKAKPKLVALLNVPRDESSFSLARFFGKTDRIKKEDVECKYCDTSKICSITIKPLKDVKSPLLKNFLANRY